MPASSLWHWTAIVVAALLAIGGLVVLWRALFRDRSRGRPRCPKCWYDMAGAAGLKCPECGREARHVKRLLKTRRRWRRAALGALMLIVALATAAGEPLLRLGVVRGSPSWALIPALRWQSQYNVLRELNRRADAGQLRDWEYRWLRQHICGELERRRSTPDVFLLLQLVEDIARGPGTLAYDRVTNWPLASAAETEATLRELIPLIESPIPEVGYGASRCLEAYRDRAAPAIPKLVGFIGHPDKNVRSLAKSVLIRTDPDVAFRARFLYMQEPIVRPPLDHTLMSKSGPPWKPEVQQALDSLRDTDVGDPRAIELLCQLVRSTPKRSGVSAPHPDEDIRPVAAWALCQVARDRADVESLMMTLFDDPSRYLRVVAAEYFAGMSASPSRIGAMTRALKDTDMYTRARGLEMAVRWHAVEVLPEIQTYFGPLPTRDDRRFLLFDAGVAWVRLGGDPAVAANALVADILEKERAATKNPAPLARPLLALGHLGHSSPEVMDLLSRLMNHADDRTAATASVAFALLGGDTQLATRGILEHLPPNDQTTAFGIPMYLEFLIRADRVHVPSVESWAATETPKSAVAIRTLAECGARAKGSLPMLRTLYADPNVADVARYAVQRIEQDLKSPVNPAARRTQWQQEVP